MYFEILHYLILTNFIELIANTDNVIMMTFTDILSSQLYFAYANPKYISYQLFNIKYINIYLDSFHIK